MFGRKGARNGKRSGKLPAGPEGKRCYAIGDVHGRLDLLQILFAHIATDIASRPQAQTTIVLLGDLIDRGPDSYGVIEFLRKPPDIGAKLVCLKGNHEEMMLQGMTGNTLSLNKWIAFGGDQCAKSYGIEPGQLIGRDAATVRLMLESAVPRSHLDFIRQFVNSVRFGDFLLVHAGIRPGVKLEAQTSADLRWIRDDFLGNTRDHGFMVIHGHSVTTDIQHRPNRIGIDTGAYRSGVLTAIRIEGSSVEFLQARGAPDPSFNHA